MAVKTAEEGFVTEKTIRTRTLPAGSSTTEDDSTKPWRNMGWSDYLHSLSAQAWTEHAVYLYRYDDKGNTWSVAKFATALDEFKIQENFGGGLFNVKVKKGPQLIINEDVRVEGAAKVPTPATSTTPVAGSTAGESALLLSISALIEELRASRGGNVAAEAIKNAMQLQGQIFGSGAEVLRSTLAAPVATTPAASPMDEITKQFMAAAISKMLNPADPIENFAKMATAMKAIGFGGDSGGGKTTMAMELVRQLPTVANSLVSGLQAWSSGEQARARSIEMTRGSAPPINVQPNPQPPAAAPMPGAPAPAAPSGETAQPIPEMQVQPMPIETLEQMICNIVADPNLSVEQAANEACALIERSSPGQTDMMVQQGEEWIWNLFQTMRPILGQVKDHPRLRPFIQEFIKVVKGAPIIQPPNPSALPA